jgi:AmmeMemoRadiSam system protein B/AmmeMemoRadiSam system protein A
MMSSIAANPANPANPAIVAKVRPAAVAGLFYPAAREELAREVDELLDHTPAAPPAPGWPKALIVPHAGFIYSGVTAAHAYALLAAARGTVRRVVLLGPAHRVALRGLALPGVAAFDTPLGRLAVDAAAVRQLRALPQVIESAEVHREEHALEVQLPFIQRALGEVSLVPLVVGNATAAEVAAVLELLWGGDETLILISSDMSHYHDYEAARRVDAATVEAILGSAPVSHEQACGATPIAGMLLAARARGITPALLDARNSGDAAGGKSRVVGYAAFAFNEQSPQFTPEQGRTLLGIARGSIAAAINNTAMPSGDAAWLHRCQASFVTLMRDGVLRGCIGSLQPRRSLFDDVAANARSAAFSDPRFPGLTADEFAHVDIEVSLLAVPRRMVFADHGDLMAQLVPGEDGIVLEYEGRRATFLPQVWGSIPDREQFIAQLKAKAGLPSVASARCKIWRYRAAKWREADFSG